MSDLQVSDIRDYDTPDGSTPKGRNSRLASYLGSIVSASSVLAPGDFQDSSIPCRRRPGRRPCPGRIHLGRDPRTDEIRWHCTCCADEGVITHWRRSQWDLSGELKKGHIVSLSAERARRAKGGVGVQTLHVFELDVELVHAPVQLAETVKRRVRITGASTLHDLHLCLMDAFDRQEGEPYEFLFGASYDPKAKRFAGPASAEDAQSGGWDTQTATLASLQLRPGETFGYLFDFNEEWVHRVTLLSQKERLGQPFAPLVVQGCGISPPQGSADPELWEEELLWTDLDTSYPLTSLYGPYLAEEGPDPEEWLALDDLERLLLIVEAHAHSLPDDHPQVQSILLHAVVHDLAETALAEERIPRQAYQQFCDAEQLPGDRHQAIHEIGRSRAAFLLQTATAPTDGAGQNKAPTPPSEIQTDAEKELD